MGGQSEQRDPQGGAIAHAPDFCKLFEASPGLYLVLDPHLDIVAVSNAYALATMTRREDILGHNLFEIFPDNPDDPAADGVRNLKASLQCVLHSKVADTMSVQKYDIRKPEEEGGGFEVRYWSPLNSPVLNDDGSLAYIIHRVEDVTEFIRLKQQEEEHNRVTDELRGRATQMEAEIYARTREVADANVKLKQANEELGLLYEKTLELDELKTQFFANVSHELRTPLTLILGPLARLLSSPDIDTEARHDLNVAERNARLLLRHVNDLLDIAKLDANRMTVCYSQTDLGRLVRLTASHFETVAEDRRIRYTVHAQDILFAQVDIEKCQRILLNLLSNAFKFTPDGGEISISLEDSGGAAVIRIGDSGPGVPEHLHEAVFERFRQVDGGAGRRYGGTGLGLAIVKEFVTLHGGTVSLTQAPQGGALFTVTLPLAAPAGAIIHHAELEDSALPDETVIQRVPAAPAHSADETAPLILVVEDNPDMNSFVAGILGRYYRIATAFDGKEGLEKTLALRPELIVSDMMMPNMTGDEMVTALQHHEELRETPIVMLTAKADEALRVKMLHGGVRDYISKPFSAEELLARIGSLMAERSRAETRIRLAASVFGNAQESIVITDAGANIIAVNPAFTTITEYTEEEVTGLNMRLLQSGRHDRSFYQQMWKAIVDTGNWQGEIWNRRKSGDLYLARLNISTIRNENGMAAKFIGMFSDITRIKQALEMEYLAHHDALTGLPNRLMLLPQLDHVIKRAQRNGKQGAVMFLDLDKFKQVNDMLGHAAGDDLLKMAAERMHNRLREMDMLARLGGDEFVVVLDEINDPADAAEIGRELIAQLKMPFDLPGGNVVNIGGSVGITLFPEHGHDAAQLIEFADQALYQAKEGGRGICHFYTPA